MRSNYKTEYVICALIVMSGFWGCKATIITEVKHNTVNQVEEDEDSEKKSAEDDDNSQIKKKSSAETAVEQQEASSSSQNTNTNGEGESKVLVASNLSPPDLMQEASTTVNLSYNQGDGFIATQCAVSNLVGLVVKTPCACVSGSCSVEVTGAIGVAGLASFQFAVSTAAETSALADVTIMIVPDMLDDDDSNTGFGGGSLSNSEWDSGIRFKQWTENEQEIQYDQGTGNLIETGIDTQDLLGYWRFNGDLGTAVPAAAGAILDFSENGNHGQLYDTGSQPASYEGGVLHEGILFDNDYIDVSNSGSFDMSPSSSFTIGLWVKPGANTLYHLFSNLESGTNQQYSLSALAGSTGITILFSLYGSACSGGGSAVSDSLELTNGSWYHYVAVVKPGSYSRLYRDGELVDEASPLAAMCSNTWPVNIGRRGDGTGYFSGELDEVFFFKRALDGDEVRQIYQRQKASFGGGEGSSFTSRIFDSGKNGAQWNALAWTAVSPYGKELPAGYDGASPKYDSDNTESAYTQGNADVSLFTDLVGYWRMNFPAGAVAYGSQVTDYSGNGRHGVTSDNGTDDTESIGGKFNGALLLNQFGGIVDLSQGGIPISTNITTFSASMWFYPKSRQSYNQVLLRQGVAPPCNGYLLQITPDGEIRIVVDCRWTIYTDAFVQLNEWNYVGFSYDSVNKWKIRVNAVEVSDGQGNPHIPTANTLIGAHGLGESNTYDGAIDEVLYWDRAISFDEMETLYRRGILNVRYQVRSCAVADCSDAIFTGPGNLAGAYYSEIMNSSASQPALTLSPVQTGRYFQYKMFLDTGNSSYTPLVESVQAGFE